MDLLRLALERADTAERAVATIVALLEEHGQGGGCGFENRRFTYHNSYIVADPRRAFVLETAGHLHAVEEIRGARSISNGLTIPGFAGPIATRSKRASRPAMRAASGRSNLPGNRVDRRPDAAFRDHGPGHDQPAYSWLNGAMTLRACTPAASRQLANHGQLGLRTDPHRPHALGYRNRGAVPGVIQTGANP